MTERIFRVERNGVPMFETNLNPGDGVYLSNSVDTYLASIGASAPEAEVVGEMQVEAEESELEAELEAEIEAEEVTEEELEEDDEEAEYSEWTVEELKDALRARELPVSGNKDELIERLEEDDEIEDDGE